jgi:HPt (histidine-containing phosphotransfer) domain-containing protein
MPQRARPAPIARLAPPLDAAELDRRTFGDAGLRREVLDLFAAQAPRLLAEIEHGDARGRREAAHRLKGSAAAVAAAPLAAAAGVIEALAPGDAPGRARSLARLRAELAAVLDAIARL